MKIVGEPFLIKGFPRLFFRSLKPAVCAFSVCPFVMTIPNGAAPAAHGVKKKVIEWLGPVLYGAARTSFLPLFLLI
jgi:hypothetical protein